MKIKRVLKFLCMMLIFIIFLWIFISGILFDSSVYYKQNSIISLLISFFFIFIGFPLLYKLIKNKLCLESKRNRFLFLLGYFIIIIFIQIVILNQLNCSPCCDFEIILKKAESIIHNISIDEYCTLYFQHYPRNILLLFLYIIFIKIGSLFNLSSLVSIYVMNILFINISIFLLYLTVKTKYSYKEGIFSIIVMALFLPIFLYVSIVYSDTMSMFVPIGLLYLISRNKINIVTIFIFAFLLFIGNGLKATSIIIFIAYVINEVIHKRNIKQIVFIIMISLLFNIGYNTFVEYKFNNFKVNEYGSIPYTHYIMMGLEDRYGSNESRNSYGGWSKQDIDKTRSFDNNKLAKQYHIKEIKRRLNSYTISSYALYLSKKVANTWSDGLYFADSFIQINPKNRTSFLYKAFYQDGEHPSKSIVYYAQGIQFAFLIIFLVSTILDIRNNSTEIDYVKLSILGVAIVLLFWENRSRYILNYIPLFTYVICSYYIRKSE